MNAGVELNEKGYYFAVLVFGLYSAVSLQKAIRDKEEGNSCYAYLLWHQLVCTYCIDFINGNLPLYNAGSIVLSEKGFDGMACDLSLFAAIILQKNIQDTERARERN